MFHCDEIHTQGNVTLQSRGVGMVPFNVDLPQIRITCVGSLPWRTVLTALTGSEAAVQVCGQHLLVEAQVNGAWRKDDLSPFALLGCVPSCLRAVLLWRPLTSLLPSEPACAVFCCQPMHIFSQRDCAHKPNTSVSELPVTAKTRVGTSFLLRVVVVLS